MKPLVNVTVFPSRFVKTTFTAPNGPPGVTAVILVGLLTAIEEAGCPPKATVAPNSNPLPEMLTEVPPFVTPLAGVMLAKVGGGATVTVKVPKLVVTA